MALAAPPGSAPRIRKYGHSVASRHRRLARKCQRIPSTLDGARGLTTRTRR
jgi:hypothetical protein